MGACVKFKVRDEVLLYDMERVATIGDLWALEEVGVAPEEVDAAFQNAAALAGAANADPRAMMRFGFKPMCAMIFLAHRRAGNATSWVDYARDLRPDDIEVLGIVDGDAPAPANRADRRAAGKQGKRKTATSKVGEALAATGATTVESVVGPPSVDAD